MKKYIQIKKILLILFAFGLFVPKACAQVAWVNDLRTLFTSDKAIIYEINIRTFNAKDTNNNGIIEEELGEERGTFLNAIERLDDLRALGINTVNLMPITSVGKIKALGTAGSLYAVSDFRELNPQLKSNNSDLSLEGQARYFVEECHRRGIRVIVDLPSSGSYDLYLKRPELFKKDSVQNPISPADWTDVRFLDAGENGKINSDVYKMYSDFIKMVEDLDIDGVRANVASIKPFDFWLKLIKQTRLSNPEFLFLAEASDTWNKPVCEGCVFTPYNKLLDAGFDGYYGSYFNLKDWKSSREINSHVKFNQSVIANYKEPKALIGSFATHDEVSPILSSGVNFSRMIIWLNSTLPVNAYYTDGFLTGDNYLYPLMNKKASKTFTDDDYYFVHRGKPDIFNFSRSLGGKYPELLNEVVLANKFRQVASDIISHGTFVPLRTTSSSVFAYARSFNKVTFVVIGNLDFEQTQNVKVFVPKMNNSLLSMPVKIQNTPVIQTGKIQSELSPGEIQVLVFQGIELK